MRRNGDGRVFTRTNSPGTDTRGIGMRFNYEQSHSAHTIDLRLLCPWEIAGEKIFNQGCQYSQSASKGFR
jgi:hypothetical protein